jgi:signal transduction histidine kinase
MVTVEPSGPEWLFTVTDNGIGIDAQGVGQLFQVFRRLVPAEAYDGTGIGLALCRRIIEHVGGRIWVESAGPGQGASFRFTVPGGSEFTASPA